MWAAKFVDMSQLIKRFFYTYPYYVVTEVVTVFSLRHLKKKTWPYVEPFESVC